MKIQRDKVCNALSPIADTWDPFFSSTNMYWTLTIVQANWEMDRIDGGPTKPTDHLTQMALCSWQSWNLYPWPVGNQKASDHNADPSEDYCVALGNDHLTYQWIEALSLNPVSNSDPANEETTALPEANCAISKIQTIKSMLHWPSFVPSLGLFSALVSVWSTSSAQKWTKRTLFSPRLLLLCR